MDKASLKSALQPAAGMEEDERRGIGFQALGPRLDPSLEPVTLSPEPASPTAGMEGRADNLLIGPVPLVDLSETLAEEGMWNAWAYQSSKLYYKLMIPGVAPFLLEIDDAGHAERKDVAAFIASAVEKLQSDAWEQEWIFSYRTNPKNLMMVKDPVLPASPIDRFQFEVILTPYRLEDLQEHSPIPWEGERVDDFIERLIHTYRVVATDEGSQVLSVSLVNVIEAILSPYSDLSERRTGNVEESDVIGRLLHELKDEREGILSESARSARGGLVKRVVTAKREDQRLLSITLDLDAAGMESRIFEAGNVPFPEGLEEEAQRAIEDRIRIAWEWLGSPALVGLVATIQEYKVEPKNVVVPAAGKLAIEDLLEDIAVNTETGEPRTAAQQDALYRYIQSGSMVSQAGMEGGKVYRKRKIGTLPGPENIVVRTNYTEVMGGPAGSMDGRIFVNDQRVGTYLVSFKEEDEFELTEIQIDGAFRGRGIGLLFLKWLFKKVPKENRARYFLVLVDNPQLLRILYENKLLVRATVEDKGSDPAAENISLNKFYREKQVADRNQWPSEPESVQWLVSGWVNTPAAGMEEGELGIGFQVPGLGLDPSLEPVTLSPEPASLAAGMESGKTQPVEMDHREFIGTILAGAQQLRRLEVRPIAEGVVVNPAAKLPSNFQVAAHRDLRQPLTNRFRSIPILPLPHFREGAAGFLKRQNVQMLFLDRGLFMDENRAVEVLPAEHPPAFLLYGSEVEELSEAVLATILSLKLPANGLFIFRLYKDDLGEAVFDLYA